MYMAVFNLQVDIPEEFFDSDGDSKANVLTDLQQIFADVIVSGEWPIGWNVDWELLE